MTKLYLIRHIQAEGNLFRLMQGDWDGEPTALGLRQAQHLAQRFASIPLDAIYSSDLCRAKMTAEALLDAHPLPLQLDTRLREINVGVWEGRFFGDLSHEQPEAIRRFLRREDGWQPAGAESYADVTARAWTALEEILRAHEGQSVAIVSHGVTIRCLLAKMLRIGAGDPARLPLGGNTSVSLVAYQNGGFTPVCLGDCAHLPAADAPDWDAAPDLRAEAIDPLREADFYISCYADAWRAAHGSFAGFSADSYLRAADAHHRADENAVLRLWADGEAVGLVDLDTQRGADEAWGWISLLYLREDYRNRGIGVQLLGRTIMRYRALGRRALRLTVAEDNLPARAFYRRWGFQAIGAEPGSRGRLYLMEKRIGGPGYV